MSTMDKRVDIKLFSCVKIKISKDCSMQEVSDLKVTI